MVSEDSAYIKTLAETLHGLRNESNVGMWLAVCELAAADNVPSIISTVLTVLESQDKVLVEGLSKLNYGTLTTFKKCSGMSRGSLAFLRSIYVMTHCRL